MLGGGHLALDFLNSIAAPQGTMIDRIDNGRSLLVWLTEAGALDPVGAERIAASASRSTIDRVARDAIDLREWFRTVVARAKVGGPGAITLRDAKRLNDVLAYDAMFLRVEAVGDGERFRVVTNRPWRDPRELLVPVAAAMADLVCGSDFELVRRCENPTCTIWFYDRTKGHRRRWCSQAVCGNRAKVAAHRERKRLAR